MSHWNPIRDAAAYIELGDRARDALSSPQDWNEVITIWAHQQDLPAEMIARATGHADALTASPPLRLGQNFLTCACLDHSYPSPPAGKKRQEPLRLTASG